MMQHDCNTSEWKLQDYVAEGRPLSASEKGHNALKHYAALKGVDCVDGAQGGVLGGWVIISMDDF